MSRTKSLDRWFIYALIDPRDRQVRYVGFTTTTIQKRLARHLTDTIRKPYYVSKWLSQLLARGLIPDTLQLEEGSGPDWADAEIKWIAHFKSSGANLTNLTRGGDGIVGTTRSPEYREKLRQRMLGNKLTALSIPASIAYHTGRITPPEVRAKMSVAHKGIPHSAEHRVNQRLANKAKKLSDQDIREIRALKGLLTQAELGRRYGVTRSAISRIHRGLMGVVVKD